MSYGDDLTLSYNGEIYNYIELRQDLIKRGYKFKSQTDSEVILAAYSEWGEENKIFCSRDRFGVKPFYFYSDSKKFVAGSEIKQILPMMSSTVVNESVMEHFLMTSIVDYSEETFFKDVMKLNPSENLIYDLKTNTFEIKRYFDIEKKDFSQRTKELLFLVATLLDLLVGIKLNISLKLMKNGDKHLGLLTTILYGLLVMMTFYMMQ